MKLNRIISLASLVVSLAVLFLLFKKPPPMSAPVTPAVAAANAESFQQKIQKLEQPKPSAATAPAEVHLNSAEISAAFAQAAGAIPMNAVTAQGVPTSANGQSVTAAVDPAGQPDIKDYNVNFEGDVAHGQFLTKIAGKDVWVTVSGHLGSKDGYATFEPTEFKVGDLSIPASLVNDALQKKLAEQHDRLKLPDSVGGLKVENSELVVTQK